MIEDDLRLMFRERADETDVPVPDRMGGIRAKASEQRRRTALVSVTAVVLVVAVLAAVPAVMRLGSSPDPADPATTTAQFPDTVNGDSEIASVVGEAGDKTVTLTFTPDDTDFLLAFKCPGIGAGPGIDEATINGRQVSPGCAGDGFLDDDTTDRAYHVGSVSSADDIREHWRDLGITAGTPVSITLSYRQAPAFDGRLGIGAYAMTGDRIEVADVAIPEQRTVRGKRYELADGGFDVASAGASQAALDVPALDAPALVTISSVDALDAVRRVTIDGTALLRPTPVASWSVDLPDNKEHRVVVERDEASSASVVVAYYTPAKGDP